MYIETILSILKTLSLPTKGPSNVNNIAQILAYKRLMERKQKPVRETI